MISLYYVQPGYHWNTITLLIQLFACIYICKIYKLLLKSGKYRAYIKLRSMRGLCLAANVGEEVYGNPNKLLMLDSLGASSFSLWSCSCFLRVISFIISVCSWRTSNIFCILQTKFTTRSLFPLLPMISAPKTSAVVEVTGMHNSCWVSDMRNHENQPAMTN